MPKDHALDVSPPNQQRRPEYAQTDAWIRDFLGRARIGHVVTHWGDQPFITPTTFWYDPPRHEIYFHSNAAGRVRANAGQQASLRESQVCFEASEFGKFLPSNVALEFSLQYESAVAFGAIRVLEESEQKRRALYGLIGKYFPAMTAGQDYRLITAAELRRTSVYAIAIASWSGKCNWPDRAEQSDAWPALGEEWFK